MSIEELSWDSEFFGLKVGKALISKGIDIEFDKIFPFDLTYLFADPTDLFTNEFLKLQGALLVDEKVTYLKKVMPILNNVDSIFSYESKGEEKDNEVINVGLQSGIYSRFNVDPNIPHTKFLELYSLWLRKSIDRSIAKEVYVSHLANHLNGVVTVGEKNERADIGLIAVDETARGNNIGKSLIQKVEDYCFKNKYSELQIVTQKANKNACNFYEKNGFSIDSIINIYHYWK